MAGPSSQHHYRLSSYPGPQSQHPLSNADVYSAKTGGLSRTSSLTVSMALSGMASHVAALLPSRLRSTMTSGPLTSSYQSFLTRPIGNPRKSQTTLFLRSHFIFSESIVVYRA